MEELITKLIEQSVMLAIMGVAWRLSENRANGIYDDYKRLLDKVFEFIEDNQKGANQ